MNKRLWTQLDNMDRHYQTNVVIIYGSIDEGVTQYKNTLRQTKHLLTHNTLIGLINLEVSF